MSRMSESKKSAGRRRSERGGVERERVGRLVVVVVVVVGGPKALKPYIKAPIWCQLSAQVPLLIGAALGSEALLAHCLQSDTCPTL